MLDLLTRCRLVTTDRESVTVAHEAVVRAWPRLRSWLDDDVGRPGDPAPPGCRRRGLAAARPAGQRAVPRFTAVRSPRLAADRCPGADRRRGRLPGCGRGVRRRRGGPGDGPSTPAGAPEPAASDRARRHRPRPGPGARRRLGRRSSRGRDASRTARDALVDQLAAESVALRSTQRDLAALLAVEAYRLRPDARTRSALLGVFTAAPGFLGYVPTGPDGRPECRWTQGHLLDGRHPGCRRCRTVSSGSSIRSRERRRARSRPATRMAAHSLIAVSGDETTVAEVGWEGDGYSGQSRSPRVRRGQPRPAVSTTSAFRSTSAPWP